MTRTFSIFGLALVLTAGAQAQTKLSTTLIVTATATLAVSTGNFLIAGSASFVGIGTGTVAATIPPTAFGTDPVAAPFTITISGGTMTGTISVPQSVFLSSTATNPTVNVAITGGTGTYTNASGVFNLTGTFNGSIVGGFNFSNFTGSGTLTYGGTGGGGGGGTPTPTITAVQDAASNTPSLAPGSIFVVKGTNLSASGFTQFSVPRPTTSAGVKITFTPLAGGSGTDVYLVYLFNQGGVNQLAGILPSTVAPGTYNVTVTNGTVSAPSVAQVVANKFSLFTQDSSGSGLASVQNFISQSVVDLNRLTTGAVSGVTISPAKPGQAIIAYGTGLGAFAAGDNTVVNHDYRSSATILAIVGGVSIPADYAGLAGYPGEDQINFTLPTTIPTGCTISLQISVNGNLSAPTYIAIAPSASSSACVQPGFTTSQLQKFDNGGTYTAGSFSVTQFSINVPSTGTVKSDTIGGSFAQISGFQLGSAAVANPSIIPSGSCQVIRASSSGTSTSIGGTATNLDAGAITVNGPTGSSLSNLALKQDASNNYSLTNFEGLGIPGQTNFSILGGTYSLAGAGGKDVGSFNTSITLGSPLVVTLPTSITRSAGATLTWTGGNASDLVEIIGGSVTTTGTGSSAVSNITEFICTTTAGQQTFTVPASILNQLSATGTGTAGSLIVASGATPVQFSAPLKAGGSIDLGVISSFIGISGTVTYQ